MALEIVLLLQIILYEIETKIEFRKETWSPKLHLQKQIDY